MTEYDLYMYFSPHQEEEVVGEIDITGDTAEELLASGKKLVLSPMTERDSGEVYGFKISEA